MLKNSGTLNFKDGKLFFRILGSKFGSDLPVERAAQLAVHSDPGVTSLIGQRVTMWWSESEPGRLLAHKVVLQQKIRERAFEIFESGEGGTEEENWFRAEDELSEGHDEAIRQELLKKLELVP
jgi:hypothetical protein